MICDDPISRCYELEFGPKRLIKNAFVDLEYYTF